MSDSRDLQQALEDLQSVRRRLEAILERSDAWRALVLAESRRRGRGTKTRSVGPSKRQLRRMFLAESPVHQAYQKLIDAISLLGRVTRDVEDERSRTLEPAGTPGNGSSAPPSHPQAKPRVKIKAVTRPKPGSPTRAASHSRTLTGMLTEAGFRISEEIGERSPETGRGRWPKAGAGAHGPGRDAEDVGELHVEEAEVVIIHPNAERMSDEPSSEPAPVTLAARLRREAQTEEPEGQKYTPFHGTIEEAEVEIFKPSEEL